VRATSDPTEETRAVALARLDDLEKVMVGRGFAVTVDRTFWQLELRSRDRLGPARTVLVQVSPDPSGGMAWYWRRGGIADVERLGPAEAITDTAERIARMLTEARR
jgi:hypothetical protein